MNALRSAFGRLSPDQLRTVKETYKNNLKNAKTQYEKQIFSLLLAELESFLTTIENNYLNSWRPVS